MERKLHRIPYGTMNWAEVIRECHFVDNTAYIRELEKIRTPVFLRPKHQPDAETKRQALAYAKAVTAKPDWGDVPLDVVVVEVNSSCGYDWHPIRFKILP